MNSKWTKDLKIKAKTIILLEENLGRSLHDIGYGSDVLDMIQKAQARKEKIDKLDIYQN